MYIFSSNLICGKGLFFFSGVRTPHSFVRSWLETSQNETSRDEESTQKDNSLKIQNPKWSFKH